MLHKKVVRVKESEFELEDGSVFEHPMELEEIPSPEEFQTYYDYWFNFLEEMTSGREITQNQSSLQAA